MPADQANGKRWNVDEAASASHLQTLWVLESANGPILREALQQIGYSGFLEKYSLIARTISEMDGMVEISRESNMATKKVRRGGAFSVPSIPCQIQVANITAHACWQ